MADSGKTYIRCLFCLTGKEESVAAKIKDDGLGTAFHPRKTKPFFKHGKWAASLYRCFRDMYL